MRHHPTFHHRNLLFRHPKQPIDCRIDRHLQRRHLFARRMAHQQRLRQWRAFLVGLSRRDGGAKIIGGHVGRLTFHLSKPAGNLLESISGASAVY